MIERLHFHFSLSCIGEGHGNPLQCSCLENPRDGRAWWAAIYRVAQSQTLLKRRSSSSSSSRCKELKWEWRDTRDKPYQVSEFLRVSLRNKSFPMQFHANIYFTYFFLSLFLVTGVVPFLYPVIT